MLFPFCIGGENMKLFIDCEWNGYRGEMLSLALVPESDIYGKFYIEFEFNGEFDPWVEENVKPYLKGNCVKAKIEVQRLLEKYLCSFADVTVVADWPEDIERFCNLLITGPGTRLDTPDLKFEIVRFDSISELPHNALADAKAIRKEYMSRKALSK